MRVAPEAGLSPASEKKSKKKLEAAAASAALARRRFKTVLVPSVGWPTDATPPAARKRTSKR